MLIKWERYGPYTLQSADGRYRINKRSKWGKLEYILMILDDDRIWRFLDKGQIAEEMKDSAEKQI